MPINVLQYASKIWDTADLLLGVGTKQSDFPKHMMPFFALIMLKPAGALRRRAGAGIEQR